jgi:enoyl-[acyl-carrier-protein] reductase (NADH)
MDFLVDNAVLLSAIICLVAIVGGGAILAWRILAILRTIKRTKKTIGVAAGALAADVKRVSDAVGALPQRQTEIAAALAQLQTSAGAAGIVAKHAMVARRALRAPLTYLGR